MILPYLMNSDHSEGSVQGVVFDQTVSIAHPLVDIHRVSIVHGIR